MPDETPIPDPALYFALFNEIGIINQLSRTRLEQHLPRDVTTLQFGVLNNLTRVRDGRTPQDLANAFEVPKTTMTHALAGLESKGFVQMRPNPKDGRSKQVWLCDDGRDFRNEMIQAVAGEMGPLTGQFSRDRVERLLPELSALRAIMDKARDP